MFGILRHLAVMHGGRYTNRHRLEIPAFSRFLHPPQPLGWRHSRPGIEFPFFGRRHHELDVGATDVDDENLFLVHFWPGGALIGVSLIERVFLVSAKFLA